MYVVDSSLLTSVGDSTPTVAAAVRAGINRYQESPYFNKGVQPLTMSLVPDGVIPPVPDEISAAVPGAGMRDQYLLRLARAALSPPFCKQLPATAIPLFLAGPEPRGTSEVGLSAALLNACALFDGPAIDLPNSRAFALGRAGVFYAIDYARKYMQSQDVEYVLVGGVDTYRDYRTLARLDAENRLATPGSADSFVPGEGAGFLLLSRTPRACTSGNVVHLATPGTAQESGHWYSDEPYLGNGLDQAVKLALANANAPTIKTVVASMNGESYWAKELGVMMTRNQPQLGDAVAVEHPAENFGDIGAAFGAAAIGIISHRDPGVYLPYGAADGPYRGAICVDVRKN